MARVLRLAAAALAAAMLLAPTAAAAEDRLDVNVVSLRHVDIMIYGNVPGAPADAFRESVDGDQDGNVSGEEYAVYVSAVELLVFAPVPTASEAFAMVWELENVTGASPFSAAGRFALAMLLIQQVPSMAISASMDSVPGQGRVTYLNMVGLAGPVASGAPIAASLTLRYDWDPMSSFESHELTIMAPPLLPLQVRLPGGTSAEDVHGVSGAATRSAGSVLEGTTTDEPLVLTIAPRGASVTALAFAGGLILVALVVVGYGSLVVARQPPGTGATPSGRTRE